jgi:hypothetical protein
VSDAGAQIPAVVEIEHNFFKVFSDPYFRNSEPPNEQPVFCATLGDQEVTLPLGGIIRELDLEDGNPLRIMLETIAKSLRFVNVLRYGDKVPAEVLSGEASWESGVDHLEIALQRLTMQLVMWVSSSEKMITDPLELQKLFDEKETKQKVSQAFTEAAEKLGIASKEDVANMVEEFATEMSYVEALRDRFTQLQALFKKLSMLQRTHADQNSIIEQVIPVLRLMKKPLADFQENFDRIDKETSEIMTVLSALDAKREQVRELRDELYVRFEAWEEIVEKWRGVDLQDPQEFNIPNALRELYRFLAQRYLEVDEWVLMTALKASDNGKLRYGGVMTW